MYRQKSVIFTIGKTLYIYKIHISGAKYKRKKMVSSIYIGKHTYIGKTLQSWKDIKEKKWSYIRKIPIWGYIKAHCQI